MGAPIIFGQGLNGTGVAITTATPCYFSNNVIWVNFTSGSDANAGTEPELPVKTSAQAVTNASAGSVIVYAAGNLETLSSAVAVNKAGLHFVGFGVGSGRAAFLPNSGATAAFTVTAAGCVFENLYMRSAVATSGAAGRVTSNSQGLQVLSCQFDCGAFDQEALILTAGADDARVDGCTFTATASRPTRAIGLTGSNTNVHIIDTTVNGAAFGWAGNAITVNSCTRLVVRNLALQGNADLVGTTTTSYRVFGVTTSTACKVALS